MHFSFFFPSSFISLLPPPVSLPLSTQFLSPFQALPPFPFGSDALTPPFFHLRGQIHASAPTPFSPSGPFCPLSLPAPLPLPLSWPVYPPRPFFPFVPSLGSCGCGFCDCFVLFSVILVGSIASSPVAQRCGGSC